MKTIDDLPKTTFSGRRFTRKQLKLVQEMTETFGNLSRKELAQTVCEALDWTTPKGKNKINSCLTLLEGLEACGVVSLPTRRIVKKAVRVVPAFSEQPSREPINKSLASLGSLKLQRVNTKDEREEWKAYLQTHHYLGYKQPVGSHIGYFVLSEEGEKLGCLLFSASAAWALAPRDKWIGWDKKHKTKHLNLILSNDRFLVFPWVTVPNLASHVLSLATKQIGDDWQVVHGYRPVLIETFVDSTRYLGTCYKASNWNYLGKTQGRGHSDPKHECQKTKKDIYTYPLQSDWQERLTTFARETSTKKKYRNNQPDKPVDTVDEDFLALWKNVIGLFHEVGQEYDEKWQTRKRIIDTTMLVMLIFRLVSSQNKQSYGTSIDDLWDSCRRLKLELPQKSSIAPSSFCDARKKLDESVFKCLNRKIIQAYAQEELNYTWQKHRLFAVDGSKLNVPRKLFASGYSAPSEKVYYPQALLSCLYQVHSQLPVDFDLAPHNNERECAKGHLDVLEKGDVVVYDRGYYSYLMLHQHDQTGIHAIFRLQESSATAIREFFKGTENDKIVTILPSTRTQADIRKKNPNFVFRPLQMRLLKYEIKGSVFHLGTTLIEPEQRYPIQAFVDAYHSRWGVEELYKVSKRIFDIQDFHAKSERGVKQEIFAHFVLITMNRLFANQADRELNSDGDASPPDKTTDTQSSEPRGNKKKRQTNFKNCIHVFTRNLEELLLLHRQMNKTVTRVLNLIVDQHQKIRPNRSYPRKSMRPENKWRPYAERSKRKKAAARAP